MALGDVFGQLALQQVPDALQYRQQTGNWGIQRQQIAAQQQAQAQQQQQFLGQLALHQQQVQMQQQQLQQEQARYTQGERKDWANLLIKPDTAEGTAAVAAMLPPNLFTPTERMLALNAASGQARAKAEERMAEHIGPGIGHGIALGGQYSDTQPMQDVTMSMPNMGSAMIPPPMGSMVPPEGVSQPNQTASEPVPGWTPLPAKAGYYMPPPTGVGSTSPGLQGGMLSGDLKNRAAAAHILAHPEQFEPALVETMKEFQSQSSLTPEAQDKWARYVIETGQKPPITGMGAAKVMTQVANKVVDIADSLDLPIQTVAGAGAQFKANSEALSKMTASKAILDTYGNFIRTKSQILKDALMALGKKIDLQSSRFLNRPIMAAATEFQSVPEATALLSELNSFKNEVGRFTTASPNLGGILTVEAMEQYKKVLPDNSTPAQIIAFANQADKDVAARLSSFEREKASLRSKLSKGSNPEFSNKLLGVIAEAHAPEAAQSSTPSAQFDKIDDLLRQFEEQQK